MSEDAWIAVFRDNRRWQGLYDYYGQSVKFKLAVHSASDNVVKATLQDHSTQMELIGKLVELVLVFTSLQVCMRGMATSGPSVRPSLCQTREL